MVFVTDKGLDTHIKYLLCDFGHVTYLLLRLSFLCFKVEVIKLISQDCREDCRKSCIDQSQYNTCYVELVMKKHWPFPTSHTPAQPHSRMPESEKHRGSSAERGGRLGVRVLPLPATWV